MKALCDNCKREYDCGQIDFIEDYEKNNKPMNLNEIIEKKKEKFENEFVSKTISYPVGSERSEVININDVKSFLEKAIRESVEEALRAVDLQGGTLYVDETSGEYKYIKGYCKALEDFDARVKEFMK